MKKELHPLPVGLTVFPARETDTDRIIQSLDKMAKNKLTPQELMVIEDTRHRLVMRKLRRLAKKEM